MTGVTSQGVPMRHIYSLLLYLLTPVALIYFLVRGLADRRWWRRWPERFGKFETTGRSRGIVVHAVSVGEVNAAAGLIRALRSKRPDLPITVTCLTPTGSERISGLFGNSVHHVYAPLDLPGATRRFMRSLRPKLLLVMETELWPNLFHQAQRMKVPIVISNARLTERSVRRWRRFGGLVRPTLQCASLVGAQSGDDAQRFVSLGAAEERTLTLGNLKFDIELPPDLAQKGRQWRERWGAERIVMVAGSTHEEDEIALLAAFDKVLDRHPGALLVIAPRYPERFARAADLAESSGLTVGRLSDAVAMEGAQCLVIDRMGALLAFYSAADIAFVGGTLAPVGGHTPLEAAALGRPLVFGPNTKHIEGLVAELLSAGAGFEVTDAESLHTAWAKLLEDVTLREGMGHAARRLVERERGALQRTLEVVEPYLLE